MGGIQKGFREKAVGRRIRLNSDGRQDVRKTDPCAEKRMRGPPPWRSAASRGFRQSTDPNSLSQFFPLFRDFKASGGGPLSGRSHRHTHGHAVAYGAVTYACVPDSGDQTAPAKGRPTSAALREAGP